MKRYSLIFFIILFLYPFSLFAKEFKHVKVAAYDYDTFFAFDEKNRPISGYALEYISTIANYAGWDVEFVREETFSDCLNKIINCETDVTFDMSKIPEREQFMLFPELPMGTEHYILYARSDNKNIIKNDVQTFSGKKIAVSQNDYEIELMVNWCRKHNIHAEIIPYSDSDKKKQALISGEVDLLCEVGLELTSEISSIMVIQSSDYYLVANKKRSDILRDINEAQRKLQNADPFYISRLSEKYFYESTSAKALSDDEQEWLSKHETLKIGLFTRFFSFISFDKKTGKISGLPIDLINLFLGKVSLQNLNIEYYPMDSTEQLFKSLEEKKIDLILPCYKNAELFQQNTGIITSKDIFFTIMGVLYNPNVNFRDALKKLGTLKSGIAFYFMKDHFRQSEILTYDTPEELTDALNDGTISGIIGALSGLSSYFNDEIGSFQIRPLYNDCKIAFAARKEDISLISIINKGRSLTKDSEIYSLEQSYNSSNKPTLLSYLRSHLLAVFCIFFTILSIITVAFISLFRTHKRLVNTSAVVEKQQEKLLLQQTILYEALTEANIASEAKTSFLFNMSHDLRTPMNAVMGFCNMAFQHLGNIDYVRSCLEKLRSAGEFLLLLLNDILDMSKIESGTFELSETETDITQIFKSIEPILQYSADNKKVQLNFTIDNIQNRYVYLDQKRLCKVLSNIIENAVTYNNEGGWVKVSLRQLEELRENNPVYSFTIQDNGIGMNEDFQKIMYDSFSREQNSTQAGIQGTGLGLAFCKKVVSLMKGSMSCSSKKGEGTLFTINIPFRISDKHTEITPQTDNTPVSSFSLKGKRCLIVEDNELNQEILADILEEKEVITDTADNGEIAVHKIQQYGPGHYDFILMDIQMPVMNGYEAAKAIRSMPSLQQIPIIAVSANAFEDDKQKSLQAGMNAHIAKPVDTDLLLKTLAQYL